MRSGRNIVVVRKRVREDKAHHSIWLNIVDINERLLVDREHYLCVFSDDITWFVCPNVDRERTRSWCWCWDDPKWAWRSIRQCNCADYPDDKQRDCENFSDVHADHLA